MVMKVVLEGCYLFEFVVDLVLGEYEGSNRINKVCSIIGRLFICNFLFFFIEEYKNEYYVVMKYKSDRVIIFIFLINVVYSFGYDVMVVFGKFFYV